MEDILLGDLDITEEEALKLGKTLAHNTERMPLSVLHGFLTALLSSPYVTKLDDWVFYALGEDKSFLEKSEATEILDLLLRFHNSTAKSLLCEVTHRLMMYKEDRLYMLEDAPEEEIERWCEGYLEGMDFVGGWDDDVVAMTLPIGVLANQFDLIGKPGPDGIIVKDDAEWRKFYREILPEVTKDIYCELYEQREDAQTIKDIKTGRNDLCPCGSSLKYKKCCINVEEAYH